MPEECQLGAGLLARGQLGGAQVLRRARAIDETPVLSEQLEETVAHGLAHLQHHEVRILQVALDSLGELGALVTVDQPVIEAQADVHHRPSDHLALSHHGALLHFVDAQDRHLGVVDDRRRGDGAEGAERSEAPEARCFSIFLFLFGGRCRYDFWYWFCFFSRRPFTLCET